MNRKIGNQSQSLYFTDRLLSSMKEIFAYPLTIIEAPMGYGKTTAARECLENSDANILWQRIFDNSADNFWSGFCRQLSEIDPFQAQNLMQLGFLLDNASVQETVRLMEKMIFPKHTVLVIDDFHLIESPDASLFIRQLAQYEIRNLHIVLTARYVEFPDMEELCLKGYLHHISKEDFELAPEDIRKYYQMCGIRLNNHESDRLYSYSEGWISALYLLMINYKKEGSFEIIDNIYKLVEKAIYTPLPEDTKDFLLKTCIFSSFQLEQAIFIWGDQAAGLLSEVTSKNAFITYDNKTRSYQVHTIFTNFLQELFNAKDIGFKQEVYRKSAFWNRNTENYLAAMHYFRLSDDFDNLLASLELDKGSSIRFEHRDSLISYFEECPGEIKHKHPIAMLIYALSLMTFNEPERFERVCTEFAMLMETGSFDDETAKRLMGEFELLLSFAGYNDITNMLEHVKTAGLLLNEPTAFMDTKGSWTFGSPSVLYMFYRESGMLEQEVQELEDAMPHYSRLTSGHGIGAECIMAGEHHYMQGDFQNAEIFSHRALHLSQLHSQPEITICALFLQIRLELVRGNYAQVLSIVDTMRREVEQKKVYTLMHTVDLCIGFIYSFLKQSDLIPLWLAESDFHTNRLLFPAMSFFHIICGRILLMNGRHLKFLGLAVQFTEVASIFPNLLSVIYLLIYTAAGYRKTGRNSEALESLKQALEFALPDKVYLPFAENCDYIGPLLEELRLQGYRRDEVTVIQELGSLCQRSRETISAEFFTESKPALTKRELEIAQLAAEGLSNKEIAENLFISQNTVKTQLKSIFEKLGIGSRVLLKQYFE